MENAKLIIELIFLEDVLSVLSQYFNNFVLIKVAIDFNFFLYSQGS